VVLFAFGVTETPAGVGLPGPLLLRLLADLGLSSSASRSVLLRMRRDGLLCATRAGRVAHYALTPAVGALENRLENQLRGKRPAWDGAFAGLLYEVPEASRAFRDRLRHAAHLAGYARLRPGLLIAHTDRTLELAHILDHPPPGAEALTLRVELSLPDAHRVANRIWELESLAANYRTAIASATAAIQTHAADPPTGRNALQALAD
jgi:phenylacetic acid degradation operon negative regulatory protein